MAQFQGKRTDSGIPIHIQTERYTEGDSSDSLEGSVCLGEKPGNTVFPVQLDADGYLKVNLVAGGYSQHEYQDGELSLNAYGHLILGDDGSNLQTISVDSSGRLQVEVVEGGYDGVQYEDGTTVASPFGTVALGHDGSEVYPVKVDSLGRLQVEVVEGQYTGTQYTSGDSVLSPVGTTALGHNGSNVYPVKVDSDGHLQVDIQSSPKATALNTAANVTLAVGATTQIVGSLSTRLSVIITNLATNTQTFRIGDANAGASRGIELAPGESIEIETTAAVYGYNPGGSGEAVTVMWTEE